MCNIILLLVFDFSQTSVLVVVYSSGIALRCTALELFSEHCAVSSQTCWSVCQPLLWGCCCSNRTTGDQDQAMESGLWVTSEAGVSSPPFFTVLSTSVFCCFLSTTYCQCSQICALLSAEDHATLLDPSWTLLSTMRRDWETLKKNLAQNIYF